MKEEILRSATTLALAALARYPDKPTEDETALEFMRALRLVERAAAELETPRLLRLWSNVLRKPADPPKLPR